MKLELIEPKRNGRRGRERVRLLQSLEENTALIASFYAVNVISI